MNDEKRVELEILYKIFNFFLRLIMNSFDGENRCVYFTYFKIMTILLFNYYRNHNFFEIPLITISID